ncbi:conserved Plasmodium protein, unknown function [Plasmodium gonderi]|uniref:Uncharacterized protein n=1 Tax=Plasmodium gonderi TaxID=77519 RepID=A0A1Y1JPV9_PLAGO|nr:conserved Plasmodium protein, unknown function [Plasmodium gonderi]GAW83515.1 conserved Plasmodium protein, unknown function [Plasmodium gonderi]
MNFKKTELSKNNVSLKTCQSKDISMYGEDDFFSNSTLSDVEDSYKFWENADDSNIFEICKEFESSGDETEKNGIEHNLDTPKLYSSVEINTSSNDLGIILEDENYFKKDVEKTSLNDN